MTFLSGSNPKTIAKNSNKYLHIFSKMSQIAKLLWLGAQMMYANLFTPVSKFFQQLLILILRLTANQWRIGQKRFKMKKENFCRKKWSIVSTTCLTSEKFLSNKKIFQIWKTLFFMDSRAIKFLRKILTWLNIWVQKLVFIVKKKKYLNFCRKKL